METHNLVDWLSFTVPVNWGDSTNRYDIETVIGEALAAFLGDLWQSLSEDKEISWKRGNGRSPYSMSFSDGMGITIFAGTNQDNLLLELSGIGCHAATKSGLILPIIKLASERVTRIDIATDISTDVRPTDFVDAGLSGKFTSRGMVTSESGETCYIGSKKSSRYCRVYRYNEPHPRSEYLRIEYVYRKHAAKRMCERIIQTDLDEVAMASSSLFKWEHELMKEQRSPMDMTAYRPERRSGKTLRWIIAQVAPAFKKLVKEGVIENPQEFLKEYFIEGEENEG